MVAFAPAGDRLAATAADGRVRLYESRNGRKAAERAPVPGARPFGLAWSPDGALLALGYEDRLRVEVLAAADLRTRLRARHGRAWPARGCPPSPGPATAAAGVQLTPPAMRACPAAPPRRRAASPSRRAGAASRP